MKESPLRKLLSSLGISCGPKNGEGWVGATCPFSTNHPRGDQNPSFAVRVNERGFSGFNCFQGDIKFLTTFGAKTFKEAAGTTQYVLAPTGEWTRAEIKSFGRQALWKLTLSRNGRTKEIFTTKEHRWFRRSSSGVFKEAQTHELKKGARLLATLPEKRKNWSLDPLGVAHGIMFGDGTARKDRANSGVLKLFGKKMQLAGFFSRIATTLHHVEAGHYEGVAEHVYISGPFAKMKVLPEIQKVSDPYLLGFVAGYLATDGNVAESCVSLSSSRRENLLAVKNICNFLGIGTFEIGEQRRLGFGSEISSIYVLRFIRSTLCSALLVREDQAAKLSQRSPDYERIGWQVVSARKTNRVEKVFCAEVPVHHAFTLEDYLTTGNCFSCGEHGNVLELITRLGELHSKDYGDLYTGAALDEMPTGFGEFEDVQDYDPEPELLNPAQFAGMYVAALSDRRARMYLFNRGISEKATKALHLRYDQDEQRIMFPIFGGNTKELYGFQGRSILSDEKRRGPSHKNVPKGMMKSKLLLGLHLYQKGKPLFIVEGLFAVAHLLSIGARGYCNPVAIMGSNMSGRQRDTLIDLGEDIFLCLDDDAAGDAGLFGTLRDGKHKGGGAVDMLKEEVKLKLALYPETISDVDNFELDTVRWILNEGHRKI